MEGETDPQFPDEELEDKQAEHGYLLGERPSWGVTLWQLAQVTMRHPHCGVQPKSWPG